MVVVDELVIGTVEIARPGTTPVGPKPTPPAAPTMPVAPPRRAAKVSRSKYYEEHEKILKLLRREMCLTDEEVAAKTGIDIESVKEHRQIMELDEAAIAVQEKENSPICHVDRLAKKLRTLREK